MILNEKILHTMSSSSADISIVLPAFMEVTTLMNVENEDVMIVDVETENGGSVEETRPAAAPLFNAAEKAALLDDLKRVREKSTRFGTGVERSEEILEREATVGKALESVVVFGTMIGVCIYLIYSLVTHFCDTNDISRASDSCWNTIAFLSFCTGIGLISGLSMSIAYFAWQQGLLERGTLSHQAVVSLARQIWGEEDLGQTPAAGQGEADEADSLLVTMGSENNELLARIAANELEEEEGEEAAAIGAASRTEELAAAKPIESAAPAEEALASVAASVAAASATPTPSVQDPAKDEQDEKTIRRLFQRYDIDESGTINTKEEFHSLTLNLLFKIRDRQPDPMITPEALTVVVERVGAIDESNTWDPDRYMDWFKIEFPRKA